MSTQKELAEEVLQEKVKAFNQLILECEVLADEYGLSFRVYGAGANYYSGKLNSDTGDYWHASSQGC